MGKRSQRRPMQYKKDQLGCMAGLISIFDFQKGRSTRKLLSDSRCGGRHADDAKYSRSMTDLLVDSDVRRQGSDDNEEGTRVTAGADKPPSVKKIIQEEIYSEQYSKKQISNAEVEPKQPNSHVRKNKKRTNKTFKKNHSIHIHDLDAAENAGSENVCQQNLEQEFTSYLDVNAIIDELCILIHENKLTGVKHDQHDDEFSVHSRQQFFVSEEQLSKATEVFITQKFIVGKRLSADEKTPHAKEFRDALNTLNLNKELLHRLLQDPNSLLVKHVQSLLDSQVGKDKNLKSLLEPDMSEQLLGKSRPLGLVSRKKHNFFRRKKNKSCDKRLLLPPRSAQDLNRIVVLKPEPEELLNCGIETGLASSQDSHYIMRDKGLIERAASPFTLTEIKRRLKRALSKGQHQTPSHSRNLGDSDKVIGGFFGRSSSKRDHFFNERFPKSSLHIKNGNKIGVPKDCPESVTSGYPERKVSNIYIEAKKRLSGMLSNGNENEVYSSRPDPASLWRFLSLPDYNFSPASSPRGDSDLNLVSAEMKLSAYEKFMRAERSGQFKRDIDSCLDSSVQNLGTWSSISDYNPYEMIEAPSSNENISDEVIHVYVEVVETTSPVREESNVFDASSERSSSSIDGSVQNEKVETPRLNQNISVEVIHDNEVTACSVGNDMCSDVDVEMVEMMNSVVQEESNILDASSEIRNEQSENMAEICDEESSYKSLKLELTEENLPPSCLSCSSTIKEIEHLTSGIDRPERPSPVSVLDPLYADDDISPTMSIAELPMQPLKNQFEERYCSVEHYGSHVKSRTIEKEPTFEYVKSVLRASGLIWDEIFMRPISCDQLLDSSLFEEVPNPNSHDRRLLFDTINEVLIEVFERYIVCSPWLSFVKPNIRPVPNARNAINEVWEGIDWHLLPVQSPCTLENILRKDMAKSGMWMDLRSDGESVGLEMGEAIIEELMEDTIWGLCK